jgi:Domain of unknown function (DUF4158)
MPPMIGRQRRGEARLGFAVMLCYLRFPGRIRREGEQPPAELCAFIAEQLGLDAVHFGDLRRTGSNSAGTRPGDRSGSGAAPVKPRSVSGGRSMVAADGACDRPWTDADDDYT